MPISRACGVAGRRFVLGVAMAKKKMPPAFLKKAKPGVAPMMDEKPVPFFAKKSKKK